MITYKIFRTTGFDKDFNNLDNSVKVLIIKYLKKLENSVDNEITIYVLAVGNRKIIYKRYKV